MAKSNPFQFLQDVRSEATKVTWPSRRETLITTGLVLAMVVVSSLFFFFADTIIRWGLGVILGAR
ncbi:MAG: preprotein translocase subunit SecE [Bosea sp. (in: a-proteobacteria)]|uniref:preprotein translocase subunit SecE n=1 Tax=unclassified Bosea (in: a-proteobacteria) TaxID=2653178 RepID=UPI00095B57A5|nr:MULTISPECIES: preprotein translocase subunit SecE [unclassified Bosea (in: a-proteobacteria)]MBN9454998.1 preprotein translocase subunit SecE [Bosea sp. (in: a-proteobacteria)]OJV04522.1 MAG: preprotein translocase subunit SecE [Bosea sp. 67-29]